MAIKSNSSTQFFHDFFQHNLRSSVGITVNEIVKSGSLGHGTAVPGEFDLDLVLYSQGEFYHFNDSQMDSEHIHRVSAMDIKLPKRIYYLDYFEELKFVKTLSIQQFIYIITYGFWSKF